MISNHRNTLHFIVFSCQQTTVFRHPFAGIFRDVEKLALAIVGRRPIVDTVF